MGFLYLIHDANPLDFLKLHKVRVRASPAPSFCNAWVRQRLVDGNRNAVQPRDFGLQLQSPLYRFSISSYQAKCLVSIG